MAGLAKFQSRAILGRGRSLTRVVAFNPNHDERGRFAESPGEGGGGSGGESPADGGDVTRKKPASKSEPLSALSAKALSAALLRPETKRAFADAMEKIEKAMTPTAATAAAQGLKNGIEYSESAREMGEQIGRDARAHFGGVTGWVVGKLASWKGRNSLGVFHAGTEKAYLSSATDKTGSPIAEFRSIQAVHAHELGHAIGHGTGLDATKEWGSIFEKEIKGRDEWGILGGYAKSHPQEAFAEVVRIFYGGMPTHEKEWVEKQYPQATAYFRLHKLIPEQIREPRSSRRVRASASQPKSPFTFGEIRDGVFFDAFDEDYELGTLAAESPRALQSIEK